MKQKKRRICAAWPIKIFKVSRKTVTIRQVGDAVAEMLLGFFDFWGMGWAVFQRATRPKIRKRFRTRNAENM